MNTMGCKFRWIACISALLLLCIVSSDKHAEQSVLATPQHAYVAEEISNDAVLSDPESDLFAHLHETNRWGLSSTTLQLQAPIGRTLSFSTTSLRIIRMAMAYLCGHTTTEHLNYAQCHTIASIRFHIGYFIYHRCQMRC